jgi:NitT/TauT family transport system substrate-binding protein
MIYRMQRPLFAALIIAAVLSPAARAAGLTHLTLSYSQQAPDFLPLWIAGDAGYFKQHGLDVTSHYLPAQEGIPALISGQEQMAGIGGSDAASAEAQGAKLKLLLTLTPTYAFQLWTRPQYASANALKGQRVGITSTTGSLYSATLLALQQLGLKSSDVILTPLGGVTNVNNSLLAGSVAAALSHAPAAYQFKRAGLVDLVDLAKKKIPSVNAGLWVSQAFIDAHRDVVQNVVDAIVEALQREKSDRAFADDEMGKVLKIKDRGELDFSYDFYVNEAMTAGAMPQPTEIQSNIDALSASNAKVKNVDAAGMVDQSFYKNATAKLGAAAKTSSQ